MALRLIGSIVVGIICSSVTAQGYPVPPLQTEYQKALFSEIAFNAKVASEAATPQVLAFFASAEFRAALSQCCPMAAQFSPEDILNRYRAETRAAELAHAFPSVQGEVPFTDLTIDWAGKLDWFPNEWQTKLLLNYTIIPGPQDEIEQSIFGCKAFQGPFPTWSESASRLVYVAHNMRQLDSGSQPVFGDVTAVFLNSYVEKMVVMAPMDTGLYGMKCLNTPKPSTLNLSWYEPNCSAWPGHVLGTLEHFDHLILPNLQYPINASVTNKTVFDEAEDLLSRTALAGRNYADLPKIALTDADAYIESNILGNPSMSEGVKFLIASFPALFGTTRGRKLQELARQRSWPLSWSLATGGRNTTHNELHSYTLRWNERILDPKLAQLNTNASLQGDIHTGFIQAWKEVEKTRSIRELLFEDYQYFWNKLRSSQVRVAPLSAASCADPVACFATDLRSSDCICKIPRPASTAFHTVVV